MRSTALFVLLALSATAVALTGGGEGSAAETIATNTNGSFAIVNSDEGEPIFAAAGLSPGESTSGSVEIANTGEEAATVTLVQGDVDDLPGLGGGLLSQRLRIRDVTVPTQPVTIYEGPLAPMPGRPLGQFAPDEAREYEFVATLPEGAPPPGPTSGDNAVQGATATVAYSWGVGEPKGSGGGGTGLPGASARQEGSGDDAGDGFPGSGAAAGDGLDVTIVKVRRVGRRGHLHVFSRCDRPCTAIARGRFGVLKAPRRFRGIAHHRARPRALTAGRAHRLRLRMPPRMRRSIRRGTLPRGAPTVRVILRATAAGGDTDFARRTVRLRIRR